MTGRLCYIICTVVFLRLALTLHGLRPAAFTIAVVNTGFAHSDVTSGVVAAVKTIGNLAQVSLYVPAGIVKDKVFQKLMNDDILDVRSYERANDTMPHYDLIFFVTPESSLNLTRTLILYSRPQVVVFLIHNPSPDMMKLLLSFHSNGHLVGLSPHVVRMIESVGLPASWVLGINPVKSNGTLVCPGLHNESLSKPWGFVVQGSIDSHRRKYSALYEPLTRLLNTSTDMEPLTVKIVGQLATPLDIPDALKEVMRLYINLPFDKYFKLIECSQALLPLFGSSAYFTHKFSSTVLASLISGVPILADSDLLRAYSFLSDYTTFRLMPNETIIDAMQRIVASPIVEHKMRRDNLAVLANRLNVATGAFLMNLLF